MTLINKFIRGLDGLANTLLQLGLSVMILISFVLITEGINVSSMDCNNVILMLVLGIVHGGFGFYLFFAGMRGLNAQSIAVLSYIAPLTSLFISILIIGEKMTFQQLVGAVLLLCSIWTGEAGQEEVAD
ncbi:DMT family transporter [Paenibacillus sp. ALJ109b]|uniref:DMT family transporter n=1 Tax=Paenibacillus sp. ALJ109b TaxID=2709068 RepID=UPI001968282C|nr:DMT family transporter [Paenibacillus sp. ALJ109b]